MRSPASASIGPAGARALGVVAARRRAAAASARHFSSAAANRLPRRRPLAGPSARSARRAGEQVVQRLEVRATLPLEQLHVEVADAGPSRSATHLSSSRSRSRTRGRKTPFSSRSTDRARRTATRRSCRNSVSTSSSVPGTLTSAMSASRASTAPAAASARRPGGQLQADLGGHARGVVAGRAHRLVEQRHRGLRDRAQDLAAPAGSPCRSRARAPAATAEPAPSCPPARARPPAAPRSCRPR